MSAIKIQLSEINEAANCLTKAFINDPLIQWIFVTDGNYQKNATKIFATWTKYCVLYGIALRTSNFESIALRKKPGDVKFSFWRLLRSGMLKTPGLIGKKSFARMEQFTQLSMQQQINNIHSEPFLYCWLIGTNPIYQKQGYGKILMNHTFELAKKDNLPCYLETASNTSKKVHIHMGYKVLSNIPLPDSEITITCMIKKNG